MAEWWNGGMAEWRRLNGGMVEWQNGGMAEWHNVRYKIVRNQDMESTQMPPWQSPSRLVTKNKEKKLGILIMLSHSHHWNYWCHDGLSCESCHKTAVTVEVIVSTFLIG